MTDMEYMQACGRNVALNLNGKDKATADLWRGKFREAQRALPEDSQRDGTAAYQRGYALARVTA